MTSVQNLKRGLEKRGHDVRILTLMQEEDIGEEEGVWRLRSISAGKIYPQARLICCFGRAQREEILRWGPDMIHSQCEFSTFLPARMLAKQLGIPLIHTYHTVYEDYTHYFSPSAAMGKKLVRAFTRKIAEQTQAVLAPTGKVARLLEDYGVTAPVYTVPTGLALNHLRTPVPQERIAGLRTMLGIQPGQRVLLFLGRMAKEKNLRELFSCFDSLKREDLVLVAAGDGPDREALMNCAARLSCGDRIIFSGMVDRECVSEYYQMADIFVSASTSETQGLTYIEALACGLPALCRKDSCLDGVVADGVNGYQFETKEEFVSYLEKMLTGDGVLEDFGTASRRISERYSMEEFARKAEEVYYESLLRWERCWSGVPGGLGRAVSFLIR